MIAQHYKDMLGAKSVIRQISEWSTARGAEIGYENVFDYSLGNPSVPAPQKFTDVCLDLLEHVDPVTLHGYTPTLTLPAVRCIAVLGQNIVTFAPFFPEYKPYVEGAGLTLRVAPPRCENFQVNFDVLDSLVDENTAAILINSPNNPSGTAYSAETLTKLAAYLKKKSAEYGHHIFLISDEPYREIAFGGKTIPYPAKFYDDTLTCYSFSKSLSVPGERIGYVAANPRCEDAAYIVPMCGQISRGTGHNCPSGLFQRAVAECLEETSDLSVYETNMELIYDELKALGFTVCKPDGTFYIFPKALEKDAKVFCQKAMKYDLALVPGDSFGCPGYFRMAYCIETEKVRRSFVAFEKFVSTEYGVTKQH